MHLLANGKIQGTLVSKLTLSPFLTLSVRNGHKLKDSRPISRVKVNNKYYNKHLIKHDEDNNSQF